MPHLQVRLRHALPALSSHAMRSPPHPPQPTPTHRADVPISVGLRPCDHKVCFACVENLRAKNIFKQDKGIKCPFCRAYVDEYYSLQECVAPRTPRLLLAARAHCRLLPSHHDHRCLLGQHAQLAAGARRGWPGRAAHSWRRAPWARCTPTGWRRGAGGRLRGAPAHAMTVCVPACCRADAAIEKFLLEANRAASVAAAARRRAGGGAAGAREAAAPSAGVSVQPPAPTVRQLTGQTDERWACTHCSTSNFAWRETCGRCNKPCTVAMARWNAPTKTVGAACWQRAAAAAAMRCSRPAVLRLAAWPRPEQPSQLLAARQPR